MLVRVGPPAYQKTRASFGPVTTPHGWPNVKRSIDIR